MSYQIEGTWNKDGNGESIWDRFVIIHVDFMTQKRTLKDSDADQPRHFDELSRLIDSRR